MANPKLKKSTNQSSKEETKKVAVIHTNEETKVFEMLAGYEDEDGIIHKTYTIREMTGRDEEAISQVKDNGSKVIATLLERCVLTIGTLSRKELGADAWKMIIKKLTVSDQDSMFMRIRIESIGDEVEASHDCPYCKAKLKSYIDLEELEVVPFHGRRVVDFELPRGYTDKKGVLHQTGTMRLSVGLDREILNPLATKNLARANTVLLTRVCKFEDGYVITEDTMSDLTSKDREYLLNLMREQLFGIKMEVEFTCTECHETFTGKLSATNFI